MCNYEKNDCCCCCFTSRQGFLIIGVLSWINFFVSMASIPSIGFEVSWIAFLPTLIICLITGLKFCQVLNNEHTEKDFETRQSFYKLYFILQVCV